MRKFINSKTESNQKEDLQDMVTKYLGEGKPFDDREGSIWMDGEMIAWRDARVHMLTHALHYASSVFEGEKSYNGKVFKLQAHSSRLKQSANLLDFEIPFSVNEINEATQQVARQYSEDELYIRPLAWRGSEMMGVSGQKNKIHLAIAAWVTPTAPSIVERLKGVGLAMSKWQRVAPTMAPIASKAAGLYMTGTLAKHAAEENGFSDALMLDYRGLIAEATTANIFFVIDEKIHTPNVDCILNGLTRQTIISLAEDLGYEIVVRDIPIEDLDSATEVFLTGTAAEVTAVNRIENHLFSPGKITESLMRGYDQCIGRT